MFSGKSWKDIKKVSVVSAVAVSILSCAIPANAGDHHNPGPQKWEKPRYVHYTKHYVPRGRHVSRLPHGYMRYIIRGLEYFYWEGMFYRHMSGTYVVVAPPPGAVVTTIPSGYTPVVVSGVPYYTINDVTYANTSSGYQVVPEPEVVIIDKAELRESAKAQIQAEQATTIATTQATNIKTIPVQQAAMSDGSFVVNVPNSKGSYTAVEIKKSGTGFVGPQGEYYTEFPKVEQLKAMYVK